MSNKAVLLDLGVFIADNNVRRNVASLRVNAQSANGEVNTRDTNVLPSGGTFTYTSIPDNSMTLIKVSKPVTADINQGSTTYSVVINSLYVTTDAITGVVLTNDGVDPSQVFIIQI